MILPINNIASTLQADSLVSFFKKLSSGKKDISTGNPASIQIGQRMLNAASSASTARSNISGAISYTNSISSGLANASSSLAELKSLSTQAASGTLTDADRSSINTTAQSIIEGLQQISSTSTFNGIENLSGGSVTIAVTSTGDTVDLKNGDISPETLGIESLDLSTSESAQTAISQIESASENVITQIVETGAKAISLNNRFTASMTNEYNLREAGSKKIDTDYQEIISEFSKSKTSSSINMALQAQGNQISNSLLNTLLKS